MRSDHFLAWRQFEPALALGTKTVVLAIVSHEQSLANASGYTSKITQWQSDGSRIRMTGRDSLPSGD